MEKIPKMNKMKTNQVVTDIFFDLDHTLWDFDKNSMLAFTRVFQKHKIDIEITDFIREYEPINFNYWKLFREDKVTKEELRRGRLIDAFSFCRFSLSSFPAFFAALIAISFNEGSKFSPGEKQLCLFAI